jgi:DNA-binding transcriptional LysR family regulator
MRRTRIGRCDGRTRGHGAPISGLPEIGMLRRQPLKQGAGSLQVRRRGVRRGEQIARDMIALRIGPDLRMVVVGYPAYLADHGIPVEPKDLTRHRCCNIRLPTTGGLYAWEFERDVRIVNVHVDGPFVLNDMHLLIDAALHGAGLAIVMEDMVAPFIADGRLVQVLEDWSPPLSGYHLYYPNRRHH